jgi:hypothetical protein
VLIEEALQAGIPTLLIDPKGDLTNLCLTFPNLAPTDFEPWVNEGDAKKAGQTVPEYAAAQATAWTEGLGGWGSAGLRSRRCARRRRSRSTRRIERRRRLNIIGSLQGAGDMTDMEIVGDEIEGFVSGLLNLVDIDADPLSSREHILLSNLILHEWTSVAASTCRRSSAWRRHRRSASSVSSTSTRSSRRRIAPRSRCA